MWLIIDILSAALAAVAVYDLFFSGDSVFKTLRELYGGHRYKPQRVWRAIPGWADGRFL